MKVGLPEIETDDMNNDQRVLVTAILEAVIRDVWDKSELPSTVDVRYFDDPYRVEIKQSRKGQAHATLMRLPNGWTTTIATASTIPGLCGTTLRFMSQTASACRRVYSTTSSSTTSYRPRR